MQSRMDEQSSCARRKGIKSVRLSSQSDRRNEYLKRQRDARRDLTRHARTLALERSDSHCPSQLPDCNNETKEETMEECSDNVSSNLHHKERKNRLDERRSRYRNQLMVSEWMIDVPEKMNGAESTIGEGWYVVARPEGKRCLVISSNGSTIARIQSGTILKKFPSLLPNGCRRKTTSDEEYCILDCIYHEPDETFYVLDMMCWKGYLLYNCTAEFRFFWIQSKLQEVDVHSTSSVNPFRFLPLPYFESTVEGIEKAYTVPFPYLKDGLLFFMKAGHYTLGLSPLVLTWKDSDTSRYTVFTERPTIVLEVDDEGQFLTMEKIVLFSENKEELEAWQVQPENLVRFTVDRVFLENGVPRVSNPVFQKRCSVQRACADSWSKIYFQYEARSNGFPIENIVEKVRNDDCGGM